MNLWSRISMDATPRTHNTWLHSDTQHVGTWQLPDTNQTSEWANRAQSSASRRLPASAPTRRNLILHGCPCVACALLHPSACDANHVPPTSICSLYVILHFTLSFQTTDICVSDYFQTFLSLEINFDNRSRPLFSKESGWLSRYGDWTGEESVSGMNKRCLSCLQRPGSF